nr:carboxymuconolactone decarboxylase family protein [uncultured Pseudoflavonifractor sp.]
MMMKDVRETDPEFVERFEHFAFDEVVNEPGQQLDEVTRHMAILATLLGCQGTEAFRRELPQALDAGVTPVMAKEVVYQAVDYLGIGRVLPFLDITNEVLKARGVALPLEGQATTTMEDRLEKGAQTQADIFGPQMLEAWKTGHINRWLAANCFGDYYTRTGLTLAQREMITFCYLAAQGGCEPQLTAHAKGNMNLGNDKAFLIRVISQCLPYIGYPRSLNAVACVNKAAEG